MASRVAGITIEIGADSTKLNKAIKTIDKDINGAQRSLKDLNKLLKLDPSNTVLLEQKEKQLSKAIEDTKNKLKTLNEAAKNPDLGEEEYDAIQREIADTQNRLKNLEKEYKNFGSVAAQKLKAVGDKMKEVGGKMTSIGKDLTMKVTGPLVAVGTIGVKKFAEVDRTMQLTNKTMSNTKEEADLLNQAMKDAAGNSIFSMNDAATATLNFARAGLDAKQAAATLAPAMNLAAGEGGELDTVSSGLVATINGFGDSFDNASTYADVFANACNNSALDVNALSGAMSVAAPIFKTAGYGVEDAALYMGVMANAGIEASVAANSLKTGIARLVKPSKEGAAALENLGISVTNSDGSMKDTITIQSELHDAFANLSESEQIAAASAIFGKNQMSNWLALINTAPSDVNKLNESIAQTGTTTEMSEAMMQGFGGSMEKLKSSIDVAMVSLGESLAPVILAVAEKLQALVNWFNNLDEGTRRVIAVIGVIVAAIGPILVIIGTVISAVGTIIGAVSAAIPVLSAVGAAIAAVGGPITLAIAAAVALIFAIKKLADNWDKIKAKAKQLGSAIVNAFKNFVAKAVNKVKEMKAKVSAKFEEIKAAATTKFNAMKNKIVQPFMNAWQKIKGVLSKIKSGFKNLKIHMPKVPKLHVEWGNKSKKGKGEGGLKINVPIPHLKWYAKAEEQPYMFRGATLFGAGERNDEILYGRRRLLSDMREASGGRSVVNNVNVTVNGASYGTPNELAKSVSRIVMNDISRRVNAW